jgi:ABC-type lipopolysaccharide export system ATPase subunit
VNKVQTTRFNNLTKKKQHGVKFTKADATAFKRLTLEKKLEMAGEIMKRKNAK